MRFFMSSNSTLTPHSLAAALAIFFSIAGVILHQTGADLAIAGYIFKLSGGAFTLRDNVWFKHIFHDLGKHLFQVAFLVVIGLQIYFYHTQAPQHKKTRTWFVLACAAITLIFVGILKATTTLPCPWAITAFGGEKAFVPLASAFDTTNFPLGHCFPAGHAAGIYAWLGIAFIFPLFSKPFWQSFCAIFFIGLLYSLVQNLRGAHFLSHDCFSIALSFAVISFVCRLKYQ